MKVFTFSFLLFFLTSTLIFAQDTSRIKIQEEGQEKGHQGGTNQFIDADGDGFNDNAPDHDGDGIPNGLDPDWQRQKDQPFVDLDGDGINDNLMQGTAEQTRKQVGPISGQKGAPQVKSPEQKQHQKGKQGKQ